MAESYPALIEMISRLEGKDKKTAEFALYCLKRLDKQVVRLRRDNERLREALRPFADESRIPPMPGESNDPRRCSMKFLKSAAAALKETGDE